MKNLKSVSANKSTEELKDKIKLKDYLKKVR